MSYRARPPLEALIGLQYIPYPGRDPRLPPVYLFRGDHPLQPARLRRWIRRTFVCFIDASKEGKSHWLKISGTINIPYCRDEEMESKYPGKFPLYAFVPHSDSSLIGLVELEVGDWLFARTCTSKGDPKDDILLSFVPPK